MIKIKSLAYYLCMKNDILYINFGFRKFKARRHIALILLPFVLFKFLVIDGIEDEIICAFISLFIFVDTIHL